MNKKEFTRYIQKQYRGKHPYQTVDYHHQRIHRGTERCWLSWENIQKLGVDWTGKRVCDIGSYFGYFSMKAFHAGASEIVAIDQNSYLLGVCSTVLRENGFSNFKCVVRKFREGVTEIPEGPFDVMMVLNVLHHIKKASKESYPEVLASMFTSAKELVFEINAAEIADVLAAAKKGRHKEIKRVKSHRKTQFGQRWVLYLKAA
jgi:2-polyprenyl-3-methyl-5-hydroxy-6-metoxy-1,4-benzoquinol methylase